MYGRKKKIVIISIVGILLVIIASILYFFLSNKESRLDIKYIGGDKYVDATLVPSDFEVIDLKTKKKIPENKIKVTADPLNINGTVATIT